jgi:septal ring factor EnvC (AmiA/AmiB activator)
MRTKLSLILLSVFVLGSCVSTKKFQEAETQVAQVKTAHTETQMVLTDTEGQLKVCETKVAELKAQIAALKEQLLPYVRLQ